MEIERGNFGGGIHMVGGSFTSAGRAAYETNFHRGTGETKRRPALSGTALVGYATAYNKCHHGPDRQVECFMPGAFSASLRSHRDVAFLKNHSWSRCYGSTTTGELELFEDDAGLAFKLLVADDADGRELLAEVENGKLQMSVGYTSDIAETKDFGGVDVRLIRQAQLGEISAVGRPAVAETVVTAMPADAVPSLTELCRSGRMKSLAAAGHFERRLAVLRRALAEV